MTAEQIALLEQRIADRTARFNEQVQEIIDRANEQLAALRETRVSVLDYNEANQRKLWQLAGDEKSSTPAAIAEYRATLDKSLPKLTVKV